MPLINCKIHFELNWIEDCILSSDRDFAKFKIMDAKLHVPVVTLSTKDNVNLTKQLDDGFIRSVSLKNCQTISAKLIEKGKSVYELLSASFQGVKILFVLAYFIVENDANNETGIKNNKKFFLPRGEINNYNVLINGRNFYDQPVNDLIKLYDEVRKLSTGNGNNYITGNLLDYTYFQNNYRLTAIVLSKQKALDADPRAI